MSSQIVRHPSLDTASTGDSVATPLPAEIAEYISDILSELREMAEANGQAALSHLLDIARHEANGQRSGHQSEDSG